MRTFLIRRSRLRLTRQNFKNEVRTVLSRLNSFYFAQFLFIYAKRLWCMRIDQHRVGETTSMYANRLVCEMTGFHEDHRLWTLTVKNKPIYQAGTWKFCEVRMCNAKKWNHLFVMVLDRVEIIMLPLLLGFSFDFYNNIIESSLKNI